MPLCTLFPTFVARCFGTATNEEDCEGKSAGLQGSFCRSILSGTAQLYGDKASSADSLLNRLLFALYGFPEGGSTADCQPEAALVQIVMFLFLPSVKQSFCLSNMPDLTRKYFVVT